MPAKTGTAQTRTAGEPTPTDASVIKTFDIPELLKEFKLQRPGNPPYTITFNNQQELNCNEKPPFIDQWKDIDCFDFGLGATIICYIKHPKLDYYDCYTINIPPLPLPSSSVHNLH